MAVSQLSHTRTTDVWRALLNPGGDNTVTLGANATTLMDMILDQSPKTTRRMQIDDLYVPLLRLRPDGQVITVDLTARDDGTTGPRKESCELSLDVRTVMDAGLSTIQRVWSIRRSWHATTKPCDHSGATNSTFDCHGIALGIFNDKMPSEVAGAVLALGLYAIYGAAPGLATPCITLHTTLGVS